MKVSVKICGIRSISSALAVIDAGADFMGLNFVPSSKRKVNMEQAQEIVGAVRGQIKIVGVFEDAEVAYVNETASTLGLDFVQLHGQEDVVYCDQMKTNVIKSIFLKKLLNQMKTYTIPFFLLDRETQGKGKLVDTYSAHNIAREYKIFLAGGLTPENVTSLAAIVKPFAVDVAGGIETDGKEDEEKIRKFVRAVKEVEL